MGGFSNLTPDWLNEVNEDIGISYHCSAEGRLDWYRASCCHYLLLLPGETLGGISGYLGKRKYFVIDITLMIDQRFHSSVSTSPDEFLLDTNFQQITLNHMSYSDIVKWAFRHSDRVENDYDYIFTFMRLQQPRIQSASCKTVVQYGRFLLVHDF